MIEFDTEKEGVVETPVMGDFPPFFFTSGPWKFDLLDLLSKVSSLLGASTTLTKSIQKGKVFFHQKLNGTESQRTPKRKLRSSY